LVIIESRHVITLDLLTSSTPRFREQSLFSHGPHPDHHQLKATRANLAGSVFNDVNLAAAQFTNVNLSDSRFTDVNFTGTRITNANLTNVDIRDCNIDGLRIDGQLVTDLIKARGK
jgi:uncharacterized protein YjbI with pentapeptide repeats